MSSSSKTQYSTYIGSLRDVTIPATAGNGSQDVRNQSNKVLLELENILVVLTTDATVTDRQVRIVVYNNADEAIGGVMAQTQSASKARNYTFTKTISECYDGGLWINYHLPLRFLDRGDYFKIDIYGGQAGDSFTAKVKMRLVRSDEKL